MGPIVELLIVMTVKADINNGGSAVGKYTTYNNYLK